MRFVIFSPGYTYVHAGVVALHRLCHLLNKAGETAVMYSDKVNPKWDTPISGSVGPDDVVVYPEIIPGNPLHGHKVVRWLLNYPQHFGVGDRDFPGEMVWSYHRHFGKGISDRELFIPVIDPALFHKDKTVKKDVDCMWIGKGTYIPQQVDETDMIQITREYLSSIGVEGLASLLKRTKTLYTYDDMTAIIPSAKMCGTKVVLLQGKEFKYPNGDYDNIKHVQPFIKEVKGFFQ